MTNKKKEMTKVIGSDLDVRHSLYENCLPCNLILAKSSNTISSLVAGSLLWKVIWLVNCHVISEISKSIASSFTKYQKKWDCGRWLRWDQGLVEEELSLDLLNLHHFYHLMMQLMLQQYFLFPFHILLLLLPVLSASEWLEAQQTTLYIIKKRWRWGNARFLHLTRSNLPKSIWLLLCTEQWFLNSL